MNTPIDQVPRKLTRVLVVDDEPSIRESYRDILQGASKPPANTGMNDMRARLFGAPTSAPVGPGEAFDLVFCAGAEEAVQAAHDAGTEGNPFAIVFLDMRMPPGPDGVWAAERIRKLDQWIDIVVVTAYSDIKPEEIARRVPPAGNLFYLQKPFHAHEVRQLATALGRRRQAEDRIRQLAYYDDVTGLPNRALFKERLSAALDSAREDDRSPALLFLDLDNFKRVNDTLGHSIGDILLCEVSKRLLLNLRSTDRVEQVVRPKDTPTLARLGGDEFTVLLSGLREPEDAGVVATRLLDALSQPITIGPHEITVGASIGIAVYPGDGVDAEALLKSADMAMYVAKREGRNQFQFYSTAMNEAAMKRMAIENGLRRALEREEFSLDYQPQMMVSSGEVVGVEALLRWRNAQLGDVSPADFIPVAEDTGMILPIGEWVLRTACTQCKRWHDQGIALPRVAVNVSVRQFAQNCFAACVASIIEETGVKPSNLELEITESVLLKDGDAALTTLRELKGLGLRLAIDDFGTGYSSLTRLKQFPVDHLKIDRTFVCGTDDDPDDRAITTAVIAMGHSIHLGVTAEGVETESQLDFLSDLRCNEAQGFYLSRPLPEEEAARFLRENLKNDGGD